MTGLIQRSLRSEPFAKSINRNVPRSNPDRANQVMSRQRRGGRDCELRPEVAGCLTEVIPSATRSRYCQSITGPPAARSRIGRGSRSTTHTDHGCRPGAHRFHTCARSDLRRHQIRSERPWCRCCCRLERSRFSHRAADDLVELFDDVVSDRVNQPASDRPHR